jgi:hypothetical protein
MLIDRILKRRDSAVTAMRDLYSTAAICGMDSAALNARALEIMAAMGKVPQWAKGYVEGYRAALMARAYETQLIHGGYMRGRFYSTSSKRGDYYGRDIDPVDWMNNAERVGFYWPMPCGFRPFYVGES